MCIHPCIYIYIYGCVGGGGRPAEAGGRRLRWALLAPTRACAAGLALQVEGSPYSGVLDAARRIVAREGVGALYRSYRTTLVMNIPFTAMHFSVYETAKKLIHGGEHDTAADGPAAAATAAAAVSGAQAHQVLPTL